MTIVQGSYACGDKLLLEMSHNNDVASTITQAMRNTSCVVRKKIATLLIYRYSRFAVKLVTQGMLYGTRRVVTVWLNLQVIQPLDNFQNNYNVGCIST